MRGVVLVVSMVAIGLVLMTALRPVVGPAWAQFLALVLSGAATWGADILVLQDRFGTSAGVSH